MIGVIKDLIFLAIYIFIFFFIGRFTYTQSFLLAVAATIITNRFISNSKKIEFTIWVTWRDLFYHPDFPQKERERLIKILEDINKGKHEKRNLLPNPLTYFIEGNLNNVWSERDKSFLIPSLTISEIGTPIPPRRYIFFSHKLSEPYKQKEDEELLLMIREENDYIKFILAIIKHRFEIEEREICKFPLSLLLDKYYLFPNKKLRKHSFKRIEDEYITLSFENKYFKIDIDHIR